MRHNLAVMAESESSRRKSDAELNLRLPTEIKGRLMVVKDKTNRSMAYHILTCIEHYLPVIEEECGIVPPSKNNYR